MDIQLSNITFAQGKTGEWNFSLFHLFSHSKVKSVIRN